MGRTMTRPLAQLALACMIPIGAYVLHGFAASNGLIHAFEELGEKITLSDGITTRGLEVTGAEELDKLLRLLLNFFWPVVNGQNTALSLHSFMFAGQGVALMAIQMIENKRHGNHTLLVSLSVYHRPVIQ